MQVSTCKFQFHYIHNNKVPNITVKLPNRSSPKKTDLDNSFKDVSARKAFIEYEN